MIPWSLAAHLVKSLDQTLVVLLAALDHARQRVGEPLFELAVGLENVRHEEVHEWPQLHQAVLQGSSGQEETSVAAGRRKKKNISINSEMQVKKHLIFC